jgi:hypothetical protein
LLWVDCNDSTEQHEHLRWIDSNKQVQVRLASTSSEALHWITENTEILLQLIARGHFRIITNRYVFNRQRQRQRQRQRITSKQAMFEFGAVY